MNYLDLINNVPDVYVKESRDFQLLLRVYECLLNGVRYDANSVTTLTNTMQIRNTFLPLLATKIGFFSNQISQLDDKSLRLILSSYPIIIKNKGSLKAIKQSINLYFKVVNADSNYLLSYVNYPTIIQGRHIQDHTISIGIDENLPKQDLLSTLLSYVLPAGILTNVYNFISFDTAYTQILNDNKITVLSAVYATDETYPIRSALRSSSDEYSLDTSPAYDSSGSTQEIKDARNTLYGALNTTELAVDGG